MKKALIVCLLFWLYGCGTDSPGSDDPIASNDPTRANLVFPYQGSLCNEGTNVTPTESTVLFEWSPSGNTDNYVLNLKNLTTGNQSTYQTAASEMSVVLNRATPYEWYIVSESNQVSATAQSDVWQFYNAGEATQNYAPFPAEIISPLMAETINTTSNEITLDWNGNDVDDDIVGYDVYFGTDNPPAMFTSDLVQTTLVVPISPAAIYYWYIITKDAEGNNSNSGIYQFRIQ
ncbi:MAG: hypothetical protein V7719_16945 [Psychroserpens sp.]|uniref:hypothetical protein n=1 Tax=Psychroserpens sp. TaxID=2020870 RepID=UPI003001C106